MSGPHVDHVARALLFDRLTDLDRGASRELSPFRTLTRKDLLASVRREVERLLTTRSLLTMDELAERELTILDYGASDLAWVSPLRPEHQRRVAQVLSRAITAFEPRLRDVQINIERYDPTKCALYATITAVLSTEHVTEPVSFPVTLQSSASDSGPEAQSETKIDVR